MGEKLPSTATAYTERNTIEWTPDGQEVRTKVRDGFYDDLLPLYIIAKANAPGLANVPSLTFEYSEGLATLTERETRVTSGGDGTGAGLTPFGEGSIEEVYGVDIIRDLLCSPRYKTLTNLQVETVRRAFEESWTDAQISAFSDLGKECLFLLRHGQESYLETGFVFRSTRRGVRYKALAATFVGINEVGTAPVTSSSSLKNLLATFPTGQWLKKPPQAIYTGHGRYDVTQEWHWATVWAACYEGGTFGEDGTWE